MIDTNALLAITFGLISQFHTIVSVPPQQIPHLKSEIRRLVIGIPPVVPVEVFVQFKNGASYYVRDGAVYLYETTNSYHQLQDPEKLSTLLGSAKLNSNEVFRLATATIGRLVRHRTQITNSPAKFWSAGQWKGSPIPFYGLTWFSTQKGRGDSATVEIDARSGEITYLHLSDAAFNDHAVAQQISNCVHQADSSTAERPVARHARVFPIPPTNEVIRAIGAVARVCERLEMSPGCLTNLADVDWEASCVFTNERLSHTMPVYRIYFADGAQFSMFDGAISACALSDKYYLLRSKDPPDKKRSFIGRINHRWPDLAKSFEEVLKSKFGFTDKILSGYSAINSVGDTEAPIGAETLARVVVIWRVVVAANAPADVMADALKRSPGFSVEFDMETGEAKSFAFNDPVLLEVFCKAQMSEN